MTTYGQSIFCIIATWAQGKKWQRCIGSKWPMDQLADGHLGLGLNGGQPFGVGLDGRVGQLRPVTSPGLKLPTQSQMADEYLVSDIKVCVQM